MGVHDGKPEIYLEVSLTNWRAEQGSCGDLAVRLQCTEISAGGLGFVFDLLENDKTVLSTGLRATEGMFLSLYLQKVTGRTPRFDVGAVLAALYQTRFATRLYSHEGPTSGSGSIWVEDGALWVGYDYAGELIACRRLDAGQVAALARLADAMDEVF